MCAPRQRRATWLCWPMALYSLMDGKWRARTLFVWKVANAMGGVFGTVLLASTTRRASVLKNVLRTKRQLTKEAEPVAVFLRWPSVCVCVLVRSFGWIRKSLHKFTLKFLHCCVRRVGVHHYQLFHDDFNAFAGELATRIKCLHSATRLLLLLQSRSWLTFSILIFCLFLLWHSRCEKSKRAKSESVCCIARNCAAMCIRWNDFFYYINSCFVH